MGKTKQKRSPEKPAGGDNLQTGGACVFCGAIFHVNPSFAERAAGITENQTRQALAQAVMQHLLIHACELEADGKTPKMDPQTQMPIMLEDGPHNIVGELQATLLEIFALRHLLSTDGRIAEHIEEASKVIRDWLDSKSNESRIVGADGAVLHSPT